MKNFKLWLLENNNTEKKNKIFKHTLCWQSWICKTGIEIRFILSRIRMGYFLNELSVVFLGSIWLFIGLIKARVWFTRLDCITPPVFAGPRSRYVVKTNRADGERTLFLRYRFRQSPYNRNAIWIQNVVERFRIGLSERVQRYGKSLLINRSFLKMTFFPNNINFNCNIRDLYVHSTSNILNKWNIIGNLRMRINKSNKYILNDIYSFCFFSTKNKDLFNDNDTTRVLKPNETFRVVVNPSGKRDEYILHYIIQ